MIKKLSELLAGDVFFHGGFFLKTVVNNGFHYINLVRGHEEFFSPDIEVMLCERDGEWGKTIKYTNGYYIGG